MEENEAPKKKAIYKKWWFWLIIVIVLAIGIGASNDTTNTTSSTNTYQNNNKVEVVMADFSTMTKEAIQEWFKTNKINGKISEEYSDSVAKGQFVSQSIETNAIIHEGDKVTVVYSLGKEPTIGQKNALKKAQSYSESMYMSKAKIYKQLTSQYGEGFSKDEAQYAIDNINADWKENALKKAKSYQSSMSMSKSKIYQQLTSPYGEEFTKDEAQYAIDHLED